MRTTVTDIADLAPEAVLLAGAGRAILLQLANPAVGHAVARHSGFAADPLPRLHRTLSYAYALTNGTPAQQRLVKSRVQRAHLPVESAGSVPPYSAADPQLQLWVAATLYETTMRVHDAVFPALPPDVAETVYRQHAVLGTALGMPADLWPASRRDFAAYWERQVAALSVDPTIRGVARELLAARQAPPWIRTLMPLARFITAGLLPAGVREQYGLPWSPRKEKLLAATFRMAALLVRVTPTRIRHAPMRHYLKRLR